MALSFRYKSVNRPNRTSVKAPMIPLTIFGKEHIDTTGLLDSGADISAMSKDMAELLGIDLDKKIDFAFGIGGEVKSIQTSINISINYKHEQYNINLPIKVILEDYSFPLLLGRAGFFDEFIITFDQIRGRITLKKADKNKMY